MIAEFKYCFSTENVNFLQVKVSPAEFVHIRVFKHLPCYGGGLFLHGVLQHHEVWDSMIEYFDQNMNFDYPQFT